MPDALEPPRIGRSRPPTLCQRRVMQHLAEGNYIVDDCWGCRLEPIGLEVARVTMRALIRSGLLADPLPLLNDNAGRPTKHGWAWINREFGVRK